MGPVVLAKAKTLVPTDSMSREELTAAQAARAEEFGILVMEGAALTFPADYPTSLDEYGDPTNLRYPLEPKERAANAAARFAQNRDAYPEAAQKVVYTRIVMAELKHKMSPMPTEELMALLPKELQDKLMETKKGLTKGRHTYYLQVQGIRMDSDPEQPVLYHYDLAFAGGRFAACAVSDKVFAIGDVVEVATSYHAMVNVSLDTPAILGVSKEPAQTLTDLVAMEKSTSSSTPNTPLPHVGEITKNVEGEPQEQQAVPLSKNVAFERFIPVTKAIATEARQELTGVVYPADRIDVHGEYADAEDLRLAAHDWLARSRDVNVEHAPGSVANTVKVAESYITTTDIPQLDAHANDWVATFKVGHDGLWKTVEGGGIRGFSIEGVTDKSKTSRGIRLHNILVTKVSLVRNPATGIGFLAKSEDAPSKKEPKAMKETIPQAVNRIQDKLVGLSKSLGMDLPQVAPKFIPAADVAEAQSNAVEQQLTYCEAVVDNVAAAAKEQGEALVKAIDAAKDFQAAHTSSAKALRDIEEDPTLAGLVATLNKPATPAGAKA